MQHPSKLSLRHPPLSDLSCFWLEADLQTPRSSVNRFFTKSCHYRCPLSTRSIRATGRPSIGIGP